MTITTLLAYWSDQKIRADQELSAARAALTAAQTGLTANRADLDRASRELAELVALNKKIRADLAVAATPADVDALETQLAQAIKGTRSKQAEVIESEAAVDAAQTTLDSATAGVGRAAARVASTATALDAADQDKDLVKVAAQQAVRAAGSVTIAKVSGHPFVAGDVVTVIGMETANPSFDGDFTISAVTDDSISYPQPGGDATSGGGIVFGKRALRLRHKLAEPPLATLTSDLAAANARIEADFPQALRDCAKERANVELKRLENAQGKADAIADLLADATDETVALNVAFKMADAAFRDYVTNTMRRFDQAQAIARRVADPKQNPLTQAESLSIHNQNSDGTPNDALNTKREAAAAARMLVATRQIKVEDEQLNVNVKTLMAQATDIDKDPSADPAVTAAQDDLKTAQDSLVEAQMAFDSGMQSDLDDWETAVPDTAWRNLADYEAAQRLLGALQVAPGGLVKAMDDEEEKLVKALQEADKKRRTLLFLEGESLNAAAKSNFAAGILARRVFGALRGDS